MNMEQDWLDNFYLHKLKKNRVALVRDIIPDPVADHLLAEDVISQVSQFYSPVCFLQL